MRTAEPAQLSTGDSDVSFQRRRARSWPAAVARRQVLDDWRVGHPKTTLSPIDLDTLAPGEGRDLANAVLRAAWSAVLVETRTLLLDLLVGADPDVVGEGL